MALPLRAFSVSASLATLAAASATAPALAGGFQIKEYSARDLGLAQAGNTTLAADATTVFSNPAGMTKLDGLQVNGGLQYIIGDGEFSNGGSVDALGNPLSGGDGGDLFQDTAVPSLYIAAPINDRLWVGASVAAPFGLSTDYEPDWIGRYHAVESNLMAVDLNASLGYRVNEWLSLGGGVSAQYADVELSNAIDFGAVCLSQIEPGAPGTCSAIGALPQQADGFVHLEGDDWSFGWNLGVLLDVSPGTRIGIAYRSEVSHDLEGEADFTVPTAIGQIIDPAFTDTGASAPLDLPQTASIGIRHQLNSEWAVMSDVSWTGWEGNLEALEVNYANPAQPRTVEELRYQNTFRYAIGAEYSRWDDLTLRAGLAYDKSPSEGDFRSARTPDADRVIAALGLSWTPRESVTVDAGYQHLFFADAPIDQAGNSGDRLVGEFDNSADIVGVSLNWRM